jgi:cytochrome c5
VSTFAKVVGYAAGLIAVFTGFSYFGIPQVVPEPPPVEEPVSASLTTAEFTALGGRIYARTCELCHSGLGDRAPKLDNVGSVWRERLADPRYRGTAKNLEEYLRESMTKPSAYVVQGFGKPGTNDGESPMPDASGGAIGLRPVEIDAVIAYLQSGAGAKVTVSPRAAPANVKEQSAAEPEKAPDALSALAKYQCNVCHKLPGMPDAGAAGALGPDLRGLAKTAAARVAGTDARSFIRASIIDPDRAITPGFASGIMPRDFAERMRVVELEMIVEYLAQER